MGRSVPFLPILMSPAGAQPNPRCAIPMRWGTSLRRVFRPFGAYIFTSTGAPTRGYAPGYDVSPLWGDRPTRESSQRCRKDTACRESSFRLDLAAGLPPYFMEDLPKAFSDKLLVTDGHKGFEEAVINVGR